MRRAVLIVEENDARRAQLRAAFTARDLPIVEVQDPVEAMAALGREPFGALLISEGKRQLSLRGLCQLAKRRHPEIRFFVWTAGATPSQLRDTLGVQAHPLPLGLAPRETVDAVVMQRQPSAFEIAHTEVINAREPLGSTSTESSGAVAAKGGPPTLTGAAPMDFEPTERLTPAPLSDFSERTLVDEEEPPFSADLQDPPALDDEPADATVVDAAHPFHELSWSPAAPSFELPAVTLPDEHAEGEASVDEQHLQDELLELCLRLMTLSRPAQVLGVPLDASREQIEEAYQRRLRELDTKRVPAGAERAVLIARVEELRAKVTRAFEALRLQQEASRPERRATRSRRKTNPW